MVNAEIFNSLNRFKNLIVYKTENYKSLKCENLLNGLLKSEKELSLEKDIEEFIVIQNECEVSFDIVISTKNKKPLSKDKVIDIEKKIKNENINIKFIDKFIREDNIIDFSKVNKDKLFSYGKKQKDSTEEKLYIIWSEILGNNNFTIYDKFYEVGGNSLKSLRLLKKINEEFNVEINIAKLFECNSISEQAEHLNKEYLNINNKEEVEVLKF
ncbi:MAG: acyl carrier protein [Clostridium sp.]